ncbi:cell division protein SepF [Candidatus Woesearchaeota archaeon]|nr:cell division protein SepF [Candidatus Woesearchaeota archaeon]
MGAFQKIKEKIAGFGKDEFPDEFTDDFIEIDSSADANRPRAKVTVKPYAVEDFSDIKQVIDDLREGYTIALVDIRSLRDKDLVELKRAVNKLKKTTDAMEGDIAGLGDHFLVITPSFAQIYRNKEVEDMQ